MRGAVPDAPEGRLHAPDLSTRTSDEGGRGSDPERLPELEGHAPPLREDAEDERVAALDVVVSTMNLMGELFECIASGAQIEPIVYNGKTRKGKIEDLYYTYAKRPPEDISAALRSIRF